MPPRRVNVFFTPPPPDRLAGRTAIVIDTLRATTTLLTLIVAGADAVYPTASDADAFALAKTLPGTRLCGERDGRRVPGFDFGNSPLELLHAGVAGETFIQSTSNGTRALTIAGPRAAKPTAGARRTLVACLRNRTAAAEAGLAPADSDDDSVRPERSRRGPSGKPAHPEALLSGAEGPVEACPERSRRARSEPVPSGGSPERSRGAEGRSRRGRSDDSVRPERAQRVEGNERTPPDIAPPDINIVCAGEQLATAPSVEDSFTAGALVDALRDALPPGDLLLEGGARLALRLYHAYGRDPARAFADAPHAAYLAQIGYAADLDFAAQIDAESTVPVVARDAEGRLVVRR